MTKKIKYVRPRGKDNILTYRRDYPQPLRRILGNTLQRSLETSSWAEAEGQAALCDIEYARNVAKAKAEIQQERENYDREVAADWIEMCVSEWLYSEVIEEDFGAPDEIKRFNNLSEAKRSLRAFATGKNIPEPMLESFVETGVAEYLHKVALQNPAPLTSPEHVTPFIEDPVRRVSPVPSAPVTLLGLLGKWVQRSDLDETRRREVKNAVRDFLAIHEIPDIEIEAITFEMIETFFEELSERPARVGLPNAWRELPHPEMMAKFRATNPPQDYPRIKTPTLTKIGTSISAMLNDAVKRGKIQKNPLMHNIPRIKKRERVRAKYDSFPENEARMVFSAPVWTGQQPTRPHTPGSSIIEDGRYWVMPIIAWSGLRLGEAAQLRRENIQEEAGIVYFDIVAKHPEQSLKEVSSERRVPIHQELIQAGLLEFIEQREKGEWLFPELPHYKPSVRTGTLSQFYGRVLRHRVPNSGLRLVPHSWRHTFKSMLRRLGFGEQTEVWYPLMGHDDNRIGASYGDFPIEPLNDVLQRVRVHGAELHHLKDIRSRPEITIISRRKPKPLRERRQSRLKK